MAADYYQILGVSPGAEPAVIRAAYRALMRTYHPDRNGDAAAEARAREITAAFAVLGDPDRRADYDDRRAFGLAMFGPDTDRPRAQPPMRKLGLASIAIALALSLAFAMRPAWPPAPLTDEPRRFAMHDSPAAGIVVPQQAPHLSTAELAASSPAVELPAAKTADRVSPVPAEPSQLKSTARAAPPPAPAPQTEPPLAQAEAAAVPPAAAEAPAPDERRATVERIATGFLKQSLDHSDWARQQLLLSARNRAATARAMCHSDNCVADAYMGQIRDTTTIMQGGIPKP